MLLPGCQATTVADDHAGAAPWPQLYMALFSVVLLVPASLIMEPSAWHSMLTAFSAPGSFFGWFLLANCFLAYAQNLLNFWVTKFTSALSLQVGPRRPAPPGPRNMPRACMCMLRDAYIAC